MRIRAFAAVKNDMFGARGGMFTTCNSSLAHDLRAGQNVFLVVYSAPQEFRSCAPLSITYGNEGGERAGVSDERFKTDVVLQFAYGCISFRFHAGDYLSAVSNANAMALNITFVLFRCLL